jgi:hypothetical protein
MPTPAPLFDQLWQRYRARVDYAARYQAMVEERGGKIQNDHIAFRTFNCDVGAQLAGVTAIARIIEPLGYKRIDKYIFEDKKLTAWHWEHQTDITLPKIFISQLETDRLSPAIADMIHHSVAGAPDLLDPNNPAAFFTRPWKAPARDVVQEVNKESQYGSWTLLHGNAVNHFTGAVHAQGVKEWPDIETTVAALRAAGIPMKAEIEGEPGSKLRQSSTEAVDEICDVADGKLKWSYAYYEIAERPLIDGKRFEGFLGAQATNLFEMTKRG